MGGGGSTNLECHDHNFHCRSILSKSNDELNHKYGLIGEERRGSTILDAKSRKVNCITVIKLLQLLNNENQDILQYKQ